MIEEVEFMQIEAIHANYFHMIMTLFNSDAHNNKIENV